jgi:hypothetical protein
MAPPNAETKLMNPSTIHPVTSETGRDSPPPRSYSAPSRCSGRSGRLIAEPSPSRDAAHRMRASWKSWTWTPASRLTSRLRSASPAASLTAASRPSSARTRMTRSMLSTVHAADCVPFQSPIHGLELVPEMIVVTESRSSPVGG